jgi:hypothetical protein
MIRVRFGETDMLALGDDSIDELMDRAEAALDKAVDVVVAEAQLNLRKRQGTRKTAAPAGESPEQDEGDLLLSVKPGRVRRTKYGVRKEYGSDHPSAGLHEFGGTITQRGKKRTYPPRPYLRPAEATTEAEVERILEDL